MSFVRVFEKMTEIIGKLGLKDVSKSWIELKQDLELL